ncbi:MAG TPA: cytochrome C [Burkholderiaceae bacterium]|nr:cytochrome C [Burkholderiaceae bacterium]
MSSVQKPFGHVAAMVMAVALSACGGSGSNSSATDATSDGGATVKQAVTHDQIHAQSSSGVILVPNDVGIAQTFTTAGSIDTTNPFFQAFGNGRSCSSCHDINEGWSITPGTLLTRFNATNGTDPIFNLVDGTNSPLLPYTTIAQKLAASSMLLNKGLIRVGLPIPTGAEFELVAVDDPYGFASAAELSLFRRPLPTTNLNFISTVMWDARETFTDDDFNRCIIEAFSLECFQRINFDLADQSNSAVKGHAQFAAGLTTTQQNQIVNFEKTLFTAQVSDNLAGDLTSNGATGGAVSLSQNNAYFGINDLFLGDYRTGNNFNPKVMTVYNRWQNFSGAQLPPSVVSARLSIARGEALFNSKPINITGVAGINDDMDLPVLKGTCSSCHDTPNSGTHSVPLLVNVGVADVSRRTPDMPLYTLKNISTGATIQIMDPGHAMQTGKWKDIGRVKVPSLRGIETRSPYFQNGSETDLSAIINFYDKRFNIGFTPQEVTDLAAFLRVL